jgi:hypothetical protein
LDWKRRVLCASALKEGKEIPKYKVKRDVEVSGTWNACQENGQ